MTRSGSSDSWKAAIQDKYLIINYRLHMYFWDATPRSCSPRWAGRRGQNRPGKCPMLAGSDNSRSGNALPRPRPVVASRRPLARRRLLARWLQRSLFRAGCLRVWFDVILTDHPILPTSNQSSREAGSAGENKACSTSGTCSFSRRLFVSIFFFAVLPLCDRIDRDGTSATNSTLTGDISNQGSSSAGR